MLRRLVPTWFSGSNSDGGGNDKPDDCGGGRPRRRRPKPDTSTGRWIVGWGRTTGSDGTQQGSSPEEELEAIPEVDQLRLSPEQKDAIRNSWKIIYSEVSSGLV